ncbi:MAG: ABC transporter permease [Thermodesulfobacteriota bacterium]
MNPADSIKFGIKALSGYFTRSLLVLLAMAIGVASVMVLTALGEGARRYVTREFISLGTHLLFVLPGRSETVGGPPPLLAQTPRDLTLEDALSLSKISSVYRIAPISIGSAPVSWKERDREVNVIGSTSDLFEVRQLSMAQGRFIPKGDPSLGQAIAVLGHRIKNELFGNRSALGEWIRIEERRFKVIGVLAEKGESLGLDMSDIVIIPVASAQALFDTSSLFRIMVQAKSREDVLKAKEAILSMIRNRHEGEDDITVITQDAVLSTFDRILVALTLTVAGIAAISLVVAGILIMNVMLVSISQRKAEIGLLKALGAKNSQISRLFLIEAAILSISGALAGILVAMAGSKMLSVIFPSFPMEIPLWSMGAAIFVALITGLLFGVMPARRASRLDPVLALARR